MPFSMLPFFQLTWEKTKGKIGTHNDPYSVFTITGSTTSSPDSAVANTSSYIGQALKGSDTQLVRQV